jgi:DeoR family transcriptional regulator of aga operon
MFTPIMLQTTSQAEAGVEDGPDKPVVPSPGGTYRLAMKPADRRRRILDHLEQLGTGTYEEMAGLFAVSPMTVRRDVEALAAKGLLIKTLGGVQRLAEPDYYETDLRARVSAQRDEKRAIARAALALVDGPLTLFIDGGTTCIELARLLAAERQGLTVVSNSALICIELGRSRQNTIVGLGGHYDAPSMSFVGPAAEEAAGRFFVDVAFFSTKGLIPRQGTFESAIANFHIKQVAARHAGKVVLLVDHTKFGQRALSKVLEIESIHVIVTDASAPPEDVEALRQAGREVILAGPAPVPAADPSRALL